MKTVVRRWRAVSVLMIGAACVSGCVGGSRDTRADVAKQPRLAEGLGPVIVAGGLRFRDLDRDGRLSRYEDWRLPIATRVDDLVGRMTIEEKAGTMMHGSLHGVDSSTGGSAIGYARAPAIDAIRGRKVTSFITRLAVPPATMAAENNMIQRIAADTRLGIPVTISSDPRSHFQVTIGASTANIGMSQWPETLGFGALRDISLMRRFADTVRREYRAQGIHQALSPQADLFSEPRWSRGTGTFGADPELVREMTRAYIAGVQGSDAGLTRDGVAAVVKHWVGYGANPQGFDGHNYYGRHSRLTDETLKQHIHPFTGAFDVGVSGVMPTYDIVEGPRIDGRPLEPVGANFNRQLLGLLRGRYAYKGVILSDWNVTRDCPADCRDPREPQGRSHIAMPWGVEELTVSQRFAKGIAAGLDQFGGSIDTGILVDLVAQGLITEARLDQSVARILALKFTLGLFENPLVDPDATRALNDPDTMALALRTQAEAQVLLKNRNDVLPLRAGTRIYLDGIDADEARRRGLIVVRRPDEADVAVIRADAPFEMLHPNHFFGAHQHEGRLDFSVGDKVLTKVQSVGRDTPIVLSLFLDRPAVLTAIEPFAEAILANFGISDAALLDALTGKVLPRGHLPFELPRSMEAVVKQDSSAPDDSENPLYRFGAGIMLKRKGN